MKNKAEIKIFTSDNWTDYELLDSGEGEKLERVGKHTFVRPYEDAAWKKTLGKNEWDKADGKFWSSKEGAKAQWKMKNKIEPWVMGYGDMKWKALPTPFRHFGFFPEQASQWEFIENQIKSSPKTVLGEKTKFLNLFGYTGVASLFALKAGAEVTHVDASKTSIEWAKENQKLNNHLGLEKLPMRVIVDDVLKFLEREIKRGNSYDAVIMDPPKFGKGPKGETWKIETDLPKLLEKVRKVLSDKPLFVILTSYATDSSSLSLGYALESAMRDLNGKTEQGELCVIEKSNNRAISMANTTIWTAN